MQNTVFFSQGFSRCTCWRLREIRCFVVSSFLINPRPTPTIYLKSGFAEIGGFSSCRCWRLREILCFVVSSFLINPKPTPTIYLKSGFAEILFFPWICKVHLLATSRNPMFCSFCSFLINPRPAPTIYLKNGLCRNTVLPLYVPLVADVGFCIHVAYVMNSAYLPLQRGMSSRQRFGRCLSSFWMSPCLIGTRADSLLFYGCLSSNSYILSAGQERMALD